jgi:phage protein D
MSAWERALCEVYVEGTNIMPRLRPVLISLTVSDSAGAHSGSASIVVDDRYGQIVFPRTKAPMQIFLGWEGRGADRVFDGFVDDVRWSYSRSGAQLTIGAKEVDSTGPAKAGQSRHFDDKSLKEILEAAGKEAGISEVRVDDRLSDVRIPYLAMRGESFLALGQRLARENGATFKVVGTRATLVPRNGTADFPVISAAAGVNLISADMSPVIGRPRFRSVKARFYDRAQGVWRYVDAETELEGAEADGEAILDEPDEDTAKRRTKSAAAESERDAGGGSVTINGETAAQPEATCVLVGCRPGVDGSYRIDTVAHSLDRGSGFTTRLGLKKPGSDTGKDTRED